MAAHGYPENPRKNDAITGLSELMQEQANNHDFHIFHSGTHVGEDEHSLLTSGGRVLCVTALGENIKHAQQNAYKLMENIHFPGSQARNDIGAQGIEYQKHTNNLRAESQ